LVKCPFDHTMHADVNAAMNIIEAREEAKYLRGSECSASYSQRTK